MAALLSDLLSGVEHFRGGTRLYHGISEWVDDKDRDDPWKGTCQTQALLNYAALPRVPVPFPWV